MVRGAEWPFRVPPPRRHPQVGVITMTILVAYATKYGATQSIAERIGKTLEAAGQAVDVRPADQAADLSRYDAFVIGSAVYIGHWLKDAAHLVRDNADTLAEHPVWLFSSGPLGTRATDDKGEDLRTSSVPNDVVAFRSTIHPKGEHVFFGALDPGKLGVAHRAIRKFPAGRKLLPEGDFRDWDEVEAWAAAIADDLAYASRVQTTDAEPQGEQLL